MANLTPIVSLFPGRELALRRLYRHDPDFRGICDDFCAAHAALGRWQTARAAERAEEYRRLLRELGDEIADRLGAEAPRRQ